MLHIGYAVPFIASLKQLLSISDIGDCVNNPMKYFQCTDFEDGEYCKNHVLFQTNTLRILAYCDEIEIANPIGEHTKRHKLTMFYWPNLNIPPMWRSRLSTIQLLPVAKSTYCKLHGVKNLLSDFITGLKVFREDGINVNNINLKPIKGGLLCFTGNTLAIHVIGGFEEGIGLAYRLCKTCMATRDKIKELHWNNNCELRSDDQHRIQCQHLNYPLGEEARKYWLRNYSINNTSPFLDVPEFDIIKCLSYDPMYFLYEGLTPFETKLLLNYLIYEKKYFSLLYFNRSLSDAFKYLPSDSRPNMLVSECLKSNDNN